MKTTVELPDDLMRAVKMRAIEEDRKLKDVMAELLRQGLEKRSSKAPDSRFRVKLPLIFTSHPADPGEEITPERIHEILLEQDVDRALGR